MIYGIFGGPMHGIQRELLTMLEKMHAAFSERVKKLDAGDYETEDIL